MRQDDKVTAARDFLMKTEEGKNALRIIESAWDEECRGAGLYPETLFHFTDKSGLLGIIEGNFRVTYSLERIECLPLKEKPQRNESDHSPPINRTFGAPMVSFCDLRLSELRVHMRDYGSYGIGMSKAWAVKKGINPVYYISSKTELLEQFIESMAHLFSLVESQKDINKTYHRLLNFYRYMKNYDAPLYRKGALVRENHRFANEREWRFVPPIDDDLIPFVSESTMKDHSRKNSINERLDSQRLTFSPVDINYLIVENEQDVREIANYINNQDIKYPISERARLMNRILTSAQIHQDV